MLPSRADLLATLRQKASAAFVVLQVAVALAVVANAAFIIVRHAQTMGRDSGVRGDQVFSLTQQWLDLPSAIDKAQIEAINAREIADLQAIRSAPSVENAGVINTLPLTNNLWTTYVGTEPSTRSHGVLVSIYSGDERARATLGLHLASGRDFTPGEVLAQGDGEASAPPVLIVSAHLARRLFGEGSALGRLVYLNKGEQPSRVIGVVENLQSPAVYSLSDGSVWDSVLLPIRKASAFTRYIVRAKEGKVESAAAEAKEALYRLDPSRLLTEGSIYKFSDIEADAYQFDRALTYTMIAVSVIMLLIAGGGIFAITTLWVGRRIRSLGVRRALGARRSDIVVLVLVENFFLVALGCLAGIGLAIGLNMVLMKWYEADRISVAMVFAAAAGMVAIGQLAALRPALKSGAIDPGVVIRVI